MQENKVELKNDSGERLAGLKTTPFGLSNKTPAVILVHGFGVTKHEYGMFDELAAELTNSGFITYRFDFSGCGESEGDYSKTSLTKLSLDLKKIIDFVKKDPLVDEKKVGIHAQSLGTATTINLKPQVQCLVFTGSVAHPLSSLKYLFGKNYDENGLSRRVRSNGEITEIGPQAWVDLKNIDLISNIQQMFVPVLFIHGEKDIHVPLSEMEALYAVANDPKKKIILMGKEHGLMPDREEMYPLAMGWFKKYLN